MGTMDEKGENHWNYLRKHNGSSLTWFKRKNIIYKTCCNQTSWSYQQNYNLYHPHTISIQICIKVPLCLSWTIAKYTTIDIKHLQHCKVLKKNKSAFFYWYRQEWDKYGANTFFFFSLYRSMFNSFGIIFMAKMDKCHFHAKKSAFCPISQTN